MPSLNAFCNCPVNCLPVVLGAISQNQSCSSISGLKKSQVSAIVILPDTATPPVDWSLVSSWSSVIDNTDTTGTKAKILSVIGGVGASEISSVELPLGKTGISERKYTLTATRSQLSDLEYAFLKQLGCGETSFTIFFQTLGGHFYGSPHSGIDISEVNVEFILGAGINDTEQAQITLKWFGCGFPNRVALSLI